MKAMFSTCVVGGRIVGRERPAYLLQEAYESFDKA